MSVSRDFIENFRGDVFINNGPGVITRVLQKICKTEIPSEMTSDRCDGFRVYQPSEFYAVSWEAWHNYFNRDSTKSTLAMTKDSLAVHVWNKLSKDETIEVGSNVAYGIIAEKNCPRVYRASGKYFWYESRREKDVWKISSKRFFKNTVQINQLIEMWYEWIICVVAPWNWHK